MEHVLKLEVNGKFLTFYPNAKVKMIRKSPMFLNEADPGSRIYTFTIPAEPNAEILDFANLLFNNKKIATLDCNVYLKGNFYKRAKLDIVSFTKLTFDIRVRFDKPYFVEALERNIRSFEYNAPTPYRYSAESFLENIYSLSYVNTVPTVNFNVQIDFVAPLKNNDTVTKIFAYNTSTPKTLPQFMGEIAAFFTNSLKTYGIAAQIISSNELRFYSPWNNDGEVDITWVLDGTALSEFTMPVLVNGATTPLRKWQEQIKLANFTVDNVGYYDFIHFPVYNDAVKETNFNKIINDYYPAFSYFGGTQPSFQGDLLDGRTYNILSPYANLYATLQHITTELQTNVDDQFFDDELKSLYFFNNIANSLNTNLASLGYRARLTFKFADLLPNIALKDFIYNITNMFCVVFDLESNDNSMRIISRKKILQSTDITDLTKKLIYNYFAEIEKTIYSLSYTWENEPLSNTRILNIANFTEKPNVATKLDLPLVSQSKKGDLVKVIKENYYYLLKPTLGSTFDWFFYDESLEDYVATNANEQITTGFSTLFTYKVSNSFYVDEAPSYDDGGILYNNTKVTWLLPYTQTNLNFTVTDENEFSSRLIFYRGFKDCDVYYRDSIGTELAPPIGQYPFASYHNYDYKGNKCGNYSLAWNAEDGLVNVWWKQWLDLLNNSYPVTFELLLTASEFMQLDLLKKVQIENQLYLIDEMEVDLSNEMSTVKAKCYIIKTA